MIDAVHIRRTLLCMDGGAGPLGLDVSGWKRVCSSFAGESEELCESLACQAWRLCSCYVDPIGVEALMASRLMLVLVKCAIDLLVNQSCLS